MRFHAEERWLAPPGSEGRLLVRGFPREADHRCGEGGADRGARDPAGLARGLDLAARERVSKNEAVLRAVERADEATSIDDDVMAAYARASVEYRDALDRLGSV